jgi:hypothetical protein
MAVSLAQYPVGALELFALDSPSSSVVSYICNDATTAASLVSKLTSSSISSSSTTTCNSLKWVINRCNSMNVMCVNCSDPCTATCASHKLLNPSVAACTSSFQGVTMLGVGFYQPAAPAINVTRTSVSTQSVSLTFAFTEKAVVSCSPYASGVVPASSSAMSTFAYSATASAVSTSSFQAVVSITGLVPLQAYDVYCYTQGFRNNAMTYAQMLSTGKISQTTLFGKRATVSVGLATIAVSGSSASSIRLSLDFAPSSDLTVALTVTDGNGGSYALYPASVTFTSTSVSLSATFSVTTTATASAGNRTVAVSFSGASVSQYYSSPAYKNGISSFVVLAAGTSPPPPKLLAAQFSNSGSQLTITLDSPASLSPTPTSTFTCSKLFSFGGASSSSCSQASSSTFVAYLSASATVIPYISGTATSYQTVSLVPGTFTVSAVCSSSVTNCKTAVSSTVNVASAASPVSPSVAVTAPAFVSSASCTQFIIDASSSTGSGGRSWSTVTATASSANGNVTGANILLKSYQVTRPTLLNSGNFTVGTYTFAVILCNFLGACGTGISTVAVIDSGTIPFTTVYGSQSRSTTRNLAFRLTYDSYTTTCSGSVSRSNLVSSLVITRGTSSVILTGIQKQPGAYSLPAYAFPAYSTSLSNIYTFALTVSYSLSTLAPTTVYTYVTIVQSSIVATIVGGSTQGARIGSTVTIDGSKSYDPDQNLYGYRTGLAFVFSCNELSPSFSPSCSFNTSAATTVDKMLYTAWSGSTGTTSTITLTVSDSTRSSSTSVVLQALASIAPLAKLIVSNNGATTINAVDSLSLSLSVTYALDTAIRLTCAGVDLSSFSVQPTSRNVTGSGVFSSAFSIPPNSLPQGSTLTFVLSAFSSGQTLSTSSLSIIVNLPPQPGFFATSPPTGTTIGTAQSTTYLFTASNWQSDQMPLAYSFGVIVADNYLSLQSYSQLATMYTILPQGNDAADYYVTTACIVLDSLEASTQATYDIQVNPNSDPNAGLDAMNSLLESGDTDKAVANGAASLNTVACSGAPNCTAYHRSDCSTVANTCGACLSGYFGGTGPGNSPCSKSVTTDAQVRAQATLCDTSSDCDSFYSCVSNSCVLENKTCSNDCSSHGDCIFQDVNYLSQQTLSGCLADDPLCVAVCSCDSGYYRSDCSMDLAAYESAIDQRATLLEVVYNATQTADKTSANVQSWLSTATAIAQGGLNDLPDNGMRAFYKLMSYIVTVANELDLYYTYMDDILSLINAAASAEDTLSRRRLTLDQEYENEIWFAIQQYVEVVMKSLSDGLSFSQYLDRYSITLTAQSSDENVTTLVSPVSTFESTYGGVESQNIVFSGLTSVKNKFAVISWRASVFSTSLSSSFITNPISVIVNDISTCASGGCEMLYEFNNYVSESYTPDVAEVFNTTCYQGQYSVHNYACSNNLTVTAVCTGFEGWIESPCPYYQNSPSCSRLDLYGAESDNWSTGTFSDSNTTCNVTLSEEQFDGLYNETSGSIDIVPVISTSVVHSAAVTHFSPTAEPTRAPTHAPGSGSGPQGLSQTSVIVMSVLLGVGVPALAVVVWLLVQKYHLVPKSEATDDKYAVKDPATPAENEGAGVSTGDNELALILAPESQGALELGGGEELMGSPATSTLSSPMELNNVNVDRLVLGSPEGSATMASPVSYDEIPMEVPCALDDVELVSYDDIPMEVPCALDDVELGFGSPVGGFDADNMEQLAIIIQDPATGAEILGDSSSSSGFYQSLAESTNINDNTNSNSSSDSSNNAGGNSNTDADAVSNDANASSEQVSTQEIVLSDSFSAQQL